MGFCTSPRLRYKIFGSWSCRKAFTWISSLVTRWKPVEILLTVFPLSYFGSWLRARDHEFLFKAKRTKFDKVVPSSCYCPIPLGTYGKIQIFSALECGNRQSWSLPAFFGYPKQPKVNILFQSTPSFPVKFSCADNRL